MYSAFPSLLTLSLRAIFAATALQGVLSLENGSSLNQMVSEGCHQAVSLPCLKFFRCFLTFTSVRSFPRHLLPLFTTPTAITSLFGTQSNRKSVQHVVLSHLAPVMSRES